MDKPTTHACQLLIDSASLHTAHFPRDILLAALMSSHVALALETTLIHFQQNPISAQRIVERSTLNFPCKNNS